tara:strand:- start:233 stop:901 length:669 start_codon:yes stop_codon:yes gene_type:complete
MYWTDTGYLLSKNNFDENSILIEAFTLEHGKFAGIVYGGSSRKQKRNFQIGNKLLLNWKSKGKDRPGYLSIELIKPIAAKFFDDKRRTVCIMSASSILKILLPERQINKKVYEGFERMLNHLNMDDWISLYIYWELLLIKQLGYETDFINSLDKKEPDTKNLSINGKILKIPTFFFNSSAKSTSTQIKEALIFNRNLLMENFIIPNRLKFPLFRNILENYYS